MTDRTSAVRKLAEQNSAQAKHTFAKTSAAGEQATRRIEDTYATTTQAAMDFHRKVLDRPGQRRCSVRMRPAARGRNLTIGVHRGNHEPCAPAMASHE